MNKIDLCKTIQMNVSKLTESENLELFKMILDTKANYTKNNNGIFLNLNWIEEELLVKINNYIYLPLNMREKKDANTRTIITRNRI